jgi:hypothetical protein
MKNINMNINKICAGIISFLAFANMGLSSGNFHPNIPLLLDPLRIAPVPPIPQIDVPLLRLQSMHMNQVLCMHRHQNAILETLHRKT